MPGFDGSGPRGMGPMTGGGRGFCNLPPMLGEKGKREPKSSQKVVGSTLFAHSTAALFLASASDLVQLMNGLPSGASLPTIVGLLVQWSDSEQDSFIAEATPAILRSRFGDVSIFLRDLLYTPGAEIPPGPIRDTVVTGLLVKSTFVRYFAIMF